MITEIFPPDILPVRSGVYRTQSVDPDSGVAMNPWGYSYFDATDRVWGCVAETAEEAFAKPDYEFAWQTKKWRGLTGETK